MLNILGMSDQPATWSLPPDVRLHWYGKTENRPGRKMGHLNALASNADAALRLLKKRRASFKV
jgi:5-(carboxyamino)imidazole ribonucleotide synthase